MSLGQKASIIVKAEVECNHLGSYDDDYIAKLWHLAQWADAPRGDQDASEMVMALSNEIVRRWLSDRQAPMYEIQAIDHYRRTLMDNGMWIDGKWTPNHLVPPDIAAKLGCITHPTPPPT